MAGSQDEVDEDNKGFSYDDVFVVIAAYNEEGRIAEVLSDLKDEGYRNIVVVDDASDDSTFEKVSSQNVFVLRHSINRGQGASLQTGIDFAVSRGAKSVVTFDADGQHLASEIKKVAKPVLDGEVDVVFGSRFLNKKTEIPWFKKVVLKGAVLFMFLFYGVRMSDAHNGFRALSRNACEEIQITADRMEHASEIVEKVHKLDFCFKEVPVTIKYDEYSMGKGQSVFNSFRIAFRLIIRKLFK